METSVEIILRSYNMRQGYINIGKKWWDLFPHLTRELELEAKPMGVIHTQFYVEKRGSHHGFSKNLKPWFRAHDLKAGDRLVIEVTESKLGREYRLLSPKEQKEIA